MQLVARMQKKQWQIRPADARAKDLAKELRVSGVLAQVLINRRITSASRAKSFLRPKLTELIEPAEMAGIDSAVKRIKESLVKKEKIVVYGDYDVDGITGVAILWELLTLLGAAVEYYIPHRIDEGYGLNEEAVRQLAESGAKVIITVDCGIGAKSEAALARQLGIDLIITDHHRISGPLPTAAAIVHPQLGNYANPDSAGAMVAFKLAWAIANEFKISGQMSLELRRFLVNATTLAAMGTVADVVDLRGENRILTHYGLKALPESKLCGIRALIEAAELTGQEINSYHIAFRLGPMLNAAGRMGHARLAVELLTTGSEMRCMKIAEYLKEQNKQRRQCERKIFKQAREMISDMGLDHPDRRTIVLANENWHSGVVGIVASRIIDKFFRPTILINSGNCLAQGSGRSIAGFDIHAALTACSTHLVRFGGHSMAAGLKIQKEKIADFAQCFEEYARQKLSEEALVSKLDIDALCRIGELNTAVVKELEMLEPFGRGNPKPIFATGGVRLISPPRRVGAKGDHLQITISDNTASVRCIGFGMGRLEKKLVETEFFSVAYEPQIDTYNGGKTVQFVLSDIRFE